MILEYEEQGSGLTFYTEEEIYRTMEESGWELSEAELQERMDASFEEWLISDERLGLIQRRLDPIIEKYSNIRFDADIMEENADTMILVKEKFYALRDENMELEQITMDSYELAKKGQNIHFSLLITFMYEYVRAYSEKYRKTELALILELPAILNKEFGNFTGIQDIPSFFLGGVGKAVGGIISVGTGFLAEGVKGIASGLGLDSELLKKIGIGLIIAVPLIGVGYILIKLKKRRKKA